MRRESSECVAQERQVAVLCVPIGRWHVRHLVQVIRREVRRVCNALQRRNEGRIDLSDRCPVDSCEEGMLLDLLGTIASESIFGLSDEAADGNGQSASGQLLELAKNLLPDHILRFLTQVNVLRELQSLPPGKNLAVGIVGILRAERWVSAEALEHDRSERPPIAFVAVTLLQEDFWRNVVRSSHGRVGELSPVCLPSRNRILATQSQRDRVDCHRVSSSLRCTTGLIASVEKLLIVSRVVLLVEASGETKVRQFDVSARIDQNVVWLDVSAERSSDVRFSDAAMTPFAALTDE